MDLRLTVRLTAAAGQTDQPAARLLALARREGLLFERLPWCLSGRPLRKGRRSVHENVLLLEGILLLRIATGPAQVWLLKLILAPSCYGQLIAI